MRTRSTDRDRQLPTRAQQTRRCLAVFSLAVVLHTVLDPAITYVAVGYLEVGAEANPLMRQWLHAGIVPFIAIHIPLYALSIGAGLALRWLLQQATGREQVAVYYVSLVAASGLACWGLVLVINNLWVIWYGAVMS